MGFALVFIPTGEIFKVDSDDSYTQATTKELFELEVRYLFEDYLKLPYVDEVTERWIVESVRQTLTTELHLSYTENEFASKAQDRGKDQKNHWVFPFIDFVKNSEVDARWCGDVDDSIADASWPNLSIDEFEIVEYGD